MGYLWSTYLIDLSHLFHFYIGFLHKELRWIWSVMCSIYSHYLLWKHKAKNVFTWALEGRNETEAILLLCELFSPRKPGCGVGFAWRSFPMDQFRLCQSVGQDQHLVSMTSLCVSKYACACGGRGSLIPAFQRVERGYAW